MGWKTDHNYEKARQEDYRAFVASVSWREWIDMHVQHKGPFLAGAASAAFVAWMVLG
jgi:hypothetical protein